MVFVCTQGDVDSCGKNGCGGHLYVTNERFETDHDMPVECASKQLRELITTTDVQQIKTTFEKSCFQTMHWKNRGKCDGRIIAVPDLEPSLELLFSIVDYFLHVLPIMT